MRAFYEFCNAALAQMRRDALVASGDDQRVGPAQEPRVDLVNGANVSGATSATLTLRNLGVADTVGYTVVVTRGGDRDWVFRADEVAGVHRFASAALGEVPLTVAESQRRFTRALLEHESRWIAYLDRPALFAALRGPG